MNESALYALSTLYSDTFVGGIYGGVLASQCSPWTSWTSSVSGVASYQSISFWSSNGGISTCADPTVATRICNGIRVGTASAWLCGSDVWGVAPCGDGLELYVSSSAQQACGCMPEGHSIRPCVGGSLTNLSWGGWGTDTCNAPTTQTLSVQCVHARCASRTMRRAHPTRRVDYIR